jgi:Tol biopolymer transport system component
VKIPIAALVLTLLVSVVTISSAAQKVDYPGKTIESDHFILHYEPGLLEFTKEVGSILEELYQIYRATYHLTLPEKTEVLITADIDHSNSFAYANLNIIAVDAGDFGLTFNLRGSGDYLRDVVAHEYAHVLSISSSFKAPAPIPYAQFGYFSHPNGIRRSTDKRGEPTGVGMRVEALHIVPNEVLPPWFYEGIAQYESLRNRGDRWDSHRDMILRTLTLSNTLLSWDHMSVFSGKGDDYEKTYNHGFAMVRYIAETYGYDKVAAILQYSSRMLRFNFDRTIKEVIGIDADRLYSDWKKWLESRYRQQIQELGTQVYGRKLNKDGFENYWPRFSPDEKKVYFVSNGKNDYSYGLSTLHSYSFSDTVTEKKRIIAEPVAIGGFYDLSDTAGLLLFASRKSPRSTRPYFKGGSRVYDLFIDTLAEKKEGFTLFDKKTERQVSVRQNLVAATFSPDARRIAAITDRGDRHYLCILDTSKNARPQLLYPPLRSTDSSIQTMYTVQWSPSGTEIALSYIERSGDRKIGLYNTLDSSFSVLCDTEHDERDPRFSTDGSRLYFSSDRSGIFNIYRYSFTDGSLERITNVAGGAFAPDVSKDEQKLVYVNYDKNGYGIYYIDSITVVEKLQSPQSPRTARHPVFSTNPRTNFGAPSPYSLLPRKFMVIPTVLSEEILTQDDDVFEGIGVFKAGGIMQLWDPFFMVNRGSVLGGYLFLNPAKINRFFSDNYAVDYDIGAFASTALLPVTLSLEYNHRNLTGTDEFWDIRTGSGEMISFGYTLIPRQILLSASIPLSRIIRAPLKSTFHLLSSYEWFDISIDDPAIRYNYSASQGVRNGVAVSARIRKPEQTSSINPRGIAYRLRYDLWNKRLLNADKPFKSAHGWITENYNRYIYNQLSGTLKSGIPTPWAESNTIHLDASGSAVQLFDLSKKRLLKHNLQPQLPSGALPVEWLPGYAYYYRDHRKKADGTDSAHTFDTVLVTGNAVARATLSYRFPLWRGSIDKKFSFVYLEHLYGAVNFSAGSGWDKPKDILQTSLNDMLTSMGTEIRLEALTFGNYPVALSLRWDRGLDRPFPIGGHRFAFKLGFSFDDWEMVEVPQYRAPRISFDP